MSDTSVQCLSLLHMHDTCRKSVMGHSSGHSHVASNPFMILLHTKYPFRITNQRKKDMQLFHIAHNIICCVGNIIIIIL